MNKLALMIKLSVSLFATTFLAGLGKIYKKFKNSKKIDDEYIDVLELYGPPSEW